MGSFISRLAQFMEENAINDNQLTVAAGLSNGLVGKAKAGGKGMTAPNIEKILCAYPELSPEWLLTGNGHMYRNPENIIPKADKISNCKNEAIPLVSEKAVGGFFNDDFAISESNVLDYYVVPKFRHLGIDFMIELVGDSMIPRLFPGDIIACAIIHNPNFIQWNKPMLIATREQGLIVKRLHKSSCEDCLLAVSDNADYDPFDLPKNEIIGLARIVGVIHLE